ncbi:MAG: HNH endonuclease [Brooklawnia sp.]|jgi:putative restriction endonuclease
MKAAVAPTDERWAEFLAEHTHLTEANFWRPTPSGQFKVVQSGEPFLFKTKAKKSGRIFRRWLPNQIVGGGFYQGYEVFSIGEAWTLFGKGNGVASLDELIGRIAQFRSDHVDANSQIGCILLRNIFFMPPHRALRQPDDFASNLTGPKGYDLSTTGRHVDLMFDTMLREAEIRWGDHHRPPLEGAGPVEFRERLTSVRLGQQAFKGRVLTSYGRRCAITGNHIVPTLEAAHIRPVTKGGEHRLDNGLLLRSDVHTLFDQGFLGINERFELQVSPLLRENWGNGKEFYEMAGSIIRLPAAKRNRPSRDSIEWHMDTTFRAR